MDVWVSSVAVFGIFGGLIAVWWLVRRKMKAEVERDWNFWTKQVSVEGGIRILYSFQLELKLADAIMNGG